MRVLTIVGSSKNGNTSEIVKYFEKKICEREGIDFDYLYLSDYDIRFCTGCHNCIFIGEDKCSCHQPVKEIEDRIIAADALILATPGYMFSVTGIMKNFLDHVAYNCHRPKYFGKKAYVLACCTKWQEKSVFTPMETWLSGAGFTFLGKSYVDMLPFPLSDSELSKRRKKLDKAADVFLKGLKHSNELKPDFGGLMIFHVFRTLCKIAPKILQADYEYFNKLNAYDKRKKWYVDSKVSILKHKAACFIEGKMQKEIVKLIDKNKLKDESGYFRNRLL